MNKIDEYIKLGQKVEDEETCPFCENYVIQHIDNLYLCPKCGANLEYDFKNKKWIIEKD